MLNLIILHRKLAKLDVTPPPIYQKLVNCPRVDIASAHPDQLCDFRGCPRVDLASAHPDRYLTLHALGGGVWRICFVTLGIAQG
jgi:hypothetical protein